MSASPDQFVSLLKRLHWKDIPCMYAGYPSAHSYESKSRSYPGTRSPASYTLNQFVLRILGPEPPTGSSTPAPLRM